MNINPVLRSRAALIAAGMLSLGAVGCATTPEPVAQQASTVQPPAALLPDSQPQVIEDRWWTQFNQPVLDALVEEAIGANRDLRVALARVREARAEAAGVESALYPSVNAALNGGRSRSQNSPLGNALSAGLNASWELDLFGQRHADADAANLNALSVEEEGKATFLLVSSESVRRYFEIQGLRQRVALLEQAAAVQRRTLALSTGRYEAGLVSAFDVQRARAALDAAQAQLPQAQEALVAASNAQAVLLGRTPDRAQPAPAWERVQVPRIPGQIPGEVLLLRPDVAAQQKKLESQAHALKSARAASYPKFVFSFDAARARVQPQGAPTITANLFGLQLGVTAPVFDAGRIRSQVAAGEARLDGAAARYEATLLAAIAEVDTAHRRLLLLDQRRQQLLLARDSAVKAAASARALYEAGVTDLLVVLNAQAQAIGQEDALLQADAAAPLAYADLMKALGGGRPAAQDWVRVSAQSR